MRWIRKVHCDIAKEEWLRVLRQIMFSISEKIYFALTFIKNQRAIIELVSDLTTVACIAALRQIVSWRGKPSTVWSDHCTNFLGAVRELKELYEFMTNLQNQEAIINYCTLQDISWKFTPGQMPPFGGLWEVAVKSFKTHFKKCGGWSKTQFQRTEHWNQLNWGLLELKASYTKSRANWWDRSINPWPFLNLPTTRISFGWTWEYYAVNEITAMLAIMSSFGNSLQEAMVERLHCDYQKV